MGDRRGSSAPRYGPPPWREVDPGPLPPEGPAYFDRDPSLVRLDQNTNPRPHPVVARAGEVARRAELQKYGSARAGRLRRALAERMGLREDQLLVGNGSDEILDTVARAHLGPGRRAAMYRPGYDLHAFFALREGASLRELPVEPFPERPRSPEPDAVLPRPPGFLKEVDVLYHSSPHNPLGTSLLLEETDALAKDLGDGLLVVDEAYAEYAGAHADEPGELWPVGLERRNTLFTRTFSKAWGLAGLRVGWGVASPGIIARLERFRIPYTLDSFAEELALAALEETSFVDESVRAVARERPRLERGLSERGFRVLPSDANFVFTYPPFDGQAVWEGLRKRGVLVRRTSPTPSCTVPLRVTVGLPEEHDRLFSALDEVLPSARGDRSPAPVARARRGR